MAFTPSTYQQRIFDFVANGVGSAFVNAVAGSGKTTTIVAAASKVPMGTRGIFLAFNKSIATELGARLEGTAFSAQTLHSAGFAAVKAIHRRTRADGNTTLNDARHGVDYWAAGGSIPGVPRPCDRVLGGVNIALSRAVAKAVSLAKLTGLVHPGVTVDPRIFTDGIAAICADYEIEIPEGFGLLVGENAVPRAFAALVAATIEEGYAHRADRISFDDMVWLAALDNEIPVRPYDFVMVDEAQDLNAVQQALVGRLAGSNGRIVAVGDPAQAIYGFAGADTEATRRMMALFDMVELPLSVCYRCPTTVLDAARLFVPHIEARDGAPAGRVREVSEDTYTREAAHGDMVLCRTNAPLLAGAYQILKAGGRKVRVMGRDIGKALVAVVEAAAKSDGFDWSPATFNVAIDAWAAAECTKILARNGNNDEDAALVQIHDRADCVREVYAANACDSVDTFEAACGALFADDSAGADAVVTFASVHRSKGLEAARVWLLAPEKMPLRADPQERNLQYVALTRAKAEFAFVGGAWAGVVVEADEADEAEVAPEVAPEVAILPSAPDAAPVNRMDVAIAAFNAAYGEGAARRVDLTAAAVDLALSDVPTVEQDEDVALDAVYALGHTIRRQWQSGTAAGRAAAVARVEDACAWFRRDAELALTRLYGAAR